MARVVGLDLGAYSVKVMTLESTLRGVSIKSFVEQPLVPAESRMAQVQLALSELNAKGALTGDVTVVAPWASEVATHVVELPFREPKKIESALGFEVEGQLPVDLSEVLYDYQFADTAVEGDASAQLLVGVIRKNSLRALLDGLKVAKCDPRIVSHSGLLLQQVLALEPASQETGAVAVIDIGHERICISVGRPGGPVERTRIFPGGGLAFDKAIAQEFGIGLPEARAWKEQYAAIGSGVVGPDAQRAERVCLLALQPMLREIRMSLKACEAQTKRGIRQVVLCGGTAKLPGLAARIEQELRLPTSLFEIPAELSAMGSNLGPEATQAWALALRGNAASAKGQRFNLRREEFAFKSDFDFVRQRTGTLVAFAAALLLLLIGSGIARNVVLQRQEKQLDAELCEITKRVLGTCEKDFTRAKNLLEGKESPVANVPQRSAANLLAELTQRVPADMTVSLDQIQVDLDRISVRCETASNKSMEDLIAALKGYKCFQEITEGKVEKSKDGSKVSTRLEIQVACPNEAGAAL
jgi:general secretion pathway protein L